jgi:hypothetical protein
LAKKLDLGVVFNSPDQDYSALPVHISRFIGAFLSAFELILEKNSSLVDELLTTAFDIFTSGDTSKQDTIVQLLREYKDWFPFSYMFNRRTGKYPKPCFDLVNQYFNAQRGDSKSLGSEDVEGLEDDDTYGDSIADSLGHDSNFPTVYAPNIMPLKPFSQNEDAENNSQSREYQNAVQRAPSEEDNNAVSTSEEYILKSYYDYSSNWNQNAVEEDEDSDRESSYYVPKPVQKRMTRIKGNRKAGGRAKSNNKKKTVFPSGYQQEQQPLASESFERSASSKTVSFADTNTSEDFTNNIPQLHGTESSQVPKKQDRPPVKVTSDEDEDNVQSFNELQDFSSPERTPRKQQSKTATTVGDDGNNSLKNPARIPAVNTRSTRSDSGDDLHFQQEINKLKTQRRLSGDESSIDLSDADRLSPNFATSNNRGEERKGNNNINAVISTIPSVKSDWKSIPNRKEHQPPLPEHPEISISKPLSMSRSRSALSDDDDEEEEEQRIARKSSSDRKVTYRKDVKTTPDRYRINTNQAYSNEKRIGDVSPPKRVSEISPDKLHRDHFRDESEKTHFNGPDITRFSMDSDNYHQKNQNKGRYRNPLDASLEQQQLQNSGGFPPSSARDWLRESDEFQEKLEEDFQQSYEAKHKNAEGPFVSSPASRISGTSSVPSGSSGSPVRRSFEFNPPQTATASSATTASVRKNMKDIASSYEQQSGRHVESDEDNSPQQESKGRFRRGGSFGMNEEKRSLSRETAMTTNSKNNKPHSSEAMEKLKENIKKRKLAKEQMNHQAIVMEETIVRSKSMEMKRKDDHHPDEIEIQPINRNILPLEMIRTKSKLFSSSASRDTADVFRQSVTSKNSFSVAASYSSQVISPLGSDGLLPDLKRISSFDLRRANPFSPGVNFQDDLEEEEERQSPGTQHDPEDYLLEKIQHEKQYQQDMKNRQSMTIVNLSQSMNEQTFYDKPFQELPVNISLPKQTELAMETGIIFEGFLNKKSSSIMGQWQKRYFVLKESPVYFCELHIYYQAIESLWGMIPLQLKCSIPIFDISAVETHGKVQAQGKQYLRKSLLFISFRFFTLSFFFSLCLFSRQRICRSLH